MIDKISIHCACYAGPETVLILFGAGTDIIERKAVAVLVIGRAVFRRYRLQLLEEIQEQSIVRQSVFILVSLRSLRQTRSGIASLGDRRHGEQSEQHTDHEQIRKNLFQHVFPPLCSVGGFIFMTSKTVIIWNDPTRNSAPPAWHRHDPFRLPSTATYPRALSNGDIDPSWCRPFP